MSKYAEDFFVSIVKSLVELRTKQNVRKNDFINHLMNYHHKKLEEGKPGTPILIYVYRTVITIQFRIAHKLRQTFERGQ